MKKIILSSIFVLMALPLFAQSPSTVVFDHTDFAVTAKYEGGYFLLPIINGNCDYAGTPATDPMKIDDLGKPATTTGVGMSAPLVSKPAGCFVYKVRAIGTSGLVSLWSVPSDPFLIPLAIPGKPVMR